MPRNDALMPQLTQWVDTFHDIMDEIVRLRKVKIKLLSNGETERAAEVSDILVQASKVLATHSTGRMQVLLATMREM